jgi:threonine/homoserine/homoserine lactone efflux protein
MTSHLIPFAAFAAVLVAIPGPAVVLVLKCTVVRGRGLAITTALGVLTADFIWATASVIGLTALLVSSEFAFQLVRYAGAAYLIYLGLRLILRPSVHAQEDAAAGASAQTHYRRRAFAEGFLNDLSNPKTVIVYASVIPQFLGNSGTPADLFVLGMVFASLGFVSLLAYAFVFGATRSVLVRGRLMRAIMRASGVVLAAFGVGLVAESS